VNKIKSIHFPPPIADEMVCAILDGRKTVTRRAVKLKYSNTHLEMRTDKYGTRLIELQTEELGVTTVKNADGTITHRLLAAEEKTSPYSPYNILYVRETWAVNNITPHAPEWNYKADYDCNIKPYCNWKWHSSICMPKEAARLFLRVTDVRVERLQSERILLHLGQHYKTKRTLYIRLGCQSVGMGY